jgi:hypothetical protein
MRRAQFVNRIVRVTRSAVSVRMMSQTVCHRLRLVDAPATLNGRRQDASTLQVLKSVAANRNPFPERTKPTITVIHSRSQEAQV